MKFLLFSDLHYWPGAWITDWKHLHQLQARAEETGCEMIVHAGDFCHGADRVKEFVDAYNDFPIPSYHCLGNHDTDHTSFEETLKYYRMPNNYYFLDRGGYRFVFTDPNYYKDGEEFVPYSLGNYYAHPHTREYMPPEQLQWLKETVESSPYPCILFSHPSFERCDGVQNREEILKIIDEANRKRPHSVLMCINGHHHRDFVRLRKNVLYFDVNAATYDILDTPHDLYPGEECEKIKNLRHTVCFRDALSAVVTLEGTTVTVEGMESAMYRGITRTMTGNSEFDGAGRDVRPEIESFRITLN